jgi:hypothetical protein
MPCSFFSQFSKETNAYIDESKLRVVLVDASHPPVEQLINSVPNNDAAVEVPVSRHTLNVENEVPVMEKVVPAPQEQISAVVTDVSSPVKQSPILREVPVIVPEEHAILAESPPPLKNESPPPLKDEYPSPVKDTSAITIEQLPALKENSVTSKETPLEETLPKEAVTLSDRGLFSGQNHQLSHVSTHSIVLLYVHFPMFSLIRQKNIRLLSMLYSWSPVLLLALDRLLAGQNLEQPPSET